MIKDTLSCPDRPIVPPSDRERGCSTLPRCRLLARNDFRLACNSEVEFDFKHASRTSRATLSPQSKALRVRDNIAA
jgi:hypothetical protein